MEKKSKQMGSKEKGAGQSQTVSQFQSQQQQPQQSAAPAAQAAADFAQLSIRSGPTSQFGDRDRRHVFGGAQGQYAERGRGRGRGEGRGQGYWRGRGDGRGRGEGGGQGDWRGRGDGRGRGEGRGQGDWKGRGDGRGRGEGRGQGDWRGRGDGRGRVRGRGQGDWTGRGRDQGGHRGQSRGQWAEDRGSMQEQWQSRESPTPSPAPSSASSVAGDSASQPTPGSIPIKISIPKAEQERLVSLIPKRSDPTKGGSKGKMISVETNMIPIRFGQNFTPVVTQYDVKFEPDKPKYMYRRIVEAVRLKHFPKRYPAYDGRASLWSAGSLPINDEFVTELPVKNAERQTEVTYKVSLTKAQDIDMTWLKNVKPGFQETQREQIAIQALDVVLRATAMRRDAISVGRSLFHHPEPGRIVNLGSGMDLWVGTFQSAVLGWKPYFNVDVAHKGFPRSQPVLDLMTEICCDRYNPELTLRAIDNSRWKLESYLKGLKVTYELPGNSTSRRTMIINELGQCARDATFELDDGEVMTVQNYFALKKRYKIRYPDFPTLYVGPKNKNILIPIEICTIDPGQVTNKKLDEQQTSTMIRAAATNTVIRKQKIMDGFSKMKFNQDPGLKEFGISVNAGFETVKARVLDPPSLTDSGTVLPRKGVWRAKGFYATKRLESKTWTILNLAERTQDRHINNMVTVFKDGGRDLGMEIGDPTPYTTMTAPKKDVRELISYFQEKKKEGLKLVVIIVPDRDSTVIYGKVKQVAELTVGILTQCIKGFTVDKRMNKATAGNILLKINAKLNGTNQVFTPEKRPHCLETPCMIVGADVTHPSPDSVGIPSIAAVAASYTSDAFRYNIQIRLQPSKTEIIQNLEEIMVEHLMFFYRFHKNETGRPQKPEHIIFYRDGVSEGQFPQVMHYELQAIRNACRKVSAEKYEPAITFLVVQKRHHIRMFPTDKTNSDDTNYNVQAGTIVDTDITHPSHIDFYLVSHASIQGTARPTKYRCLWNDNKMIEDEIEQLTYYLCHMFSRCTRSISYPAPTYYAHLGAFRARALTNNVRIHMNNLEEEQRTKMTVKPELLTGNPMFFV